MMRALSSGVAGLKAHQTALDIIGNNIANVNTAGFKASSTMFRDVLYQTLTNASGGDGKTTGGLNPAQAGYGAMASAITPNTGRGGMNATGNSYDCYIGGEGFFVVKDGEGGYKYTRVGELMFDDDGYLTDGNGNLICGMTNLDENLAYTPPADEGDTDALAIDATKGDATTDASWGPIHYKIPKDTDDDGVIDENANNKFKSVSYGADGLITATNAEGKVVTIGRVALAYFANPTGLSQEGGSYYKATANSGTPLYEEPGGESTGALVTGALEASNVDLANEFSTMITTERGFQANSKIISVADTVMETLVNMVR